MMNTNDASDDTDNSLGAQNKASIGTTNTRGNVPQDEVSISLSERRRKRQKLLRDVDASDGEVGGGAADRDAGVGSHSQCVASSSCPINGVLNTVLAKAVAGEDAVNKEILPEGAKKSASTRRDDLEIVNNCGKLLDDCDNSEKKSMLLPLAPSLEDYLTGGGHTKYAPRPEWCQFVKDPSEVGVAVCATRKNGGDRSPPVEDRVDSGRSSIDHLDIREDATAQASGGRIPLVAPAAAAAGRRWRGHHRSVLETLTNERSQYPGQVRHTQREDEGRMRLNDRANEGLLNRNQNGISNPPGLENNPFMPLLLRKTQLYQMSRGVLTDRLAPTFDAPMTYAHIVANHRWRRDNDEGEEESEGMIHDERLAEEPNRLVERDGPHHDDTQGLAANTSIELSPPLSSSKMAVFGYECDTALHKAIKLNNTEAAIRLVREGGCIDLPNAKGVTPLIIASQEGNLDVVRALLNAGANANTAMPQRSGSTALIQASHFGKLAIVEELLRYGAQVDQANLKNTTALMRACQEGHEGVVRLLLSHNAAVNRRNDESMTSLMLASQRGHASIVSMLVKAGAQVDAKTFQDSTSLMLACKRKHLHVAKILVSSGAELKLKDGKNRTVLETATRRGLEAFVQILTDSAQICLMQNESRRERNFEMARIWKMLQLEFATIQLGTEIMTIHDVAHGSVMGRDNLLQKLCQSKRALVLAMTLPAPLVELISSFIPLPLIWEKRLFLLTSRSYIDPDSAVFNALDLIDEVLETGGLLDALDSAGVEPPSNFASWSAYRLWRSRLESSQPQRRSCNYLQILARAPPSLSTIIHSHPYDMPVALFSKLKAYHDVQSAVRRLSGGGIHFDTSIANEMLVIARMAVMWCESRPMY